MYFTQLLNLLRSAVHTILFSLNCVKLHIQYMHVHVHVGNFMIVNITFTVCVCVYANSVEIVLCDVYHGHQLCEVCAYQYIYIHVQV